MSLKNRKGFTLIEIVIVLAIAALILIIVFIAVSGAQRGRRDAQRKTDLDKVAAQLENWASNHNSDYPLQAQWVTFANGATSYLKLDQTGPPDNRTIRDPNSNSYTTAAAGATIASCATTGGGANQIPNATATGAGIAYTSGTTTGSNRTYTVRICLEAGDYQHAQ